MVFFKAPADGAFKASVMQNGAWSEVPSDLICFDAIENTEEAESNE